MYLNRFKNDKQNTLINNSELSLSSMLMFVY